MAQDEVTGAQSRDMDSDHPSHVSSNFEFVKKVDESVVPEVVKHLSTAGEWLSSTSSQNVDAHTQVDSNVSEAKKMKIREKRKRLRANRRKKIELLRNLTPLNVNISPSTLGMQENSVEICSFEPSDRAPAHEELEEVVEHSNATIQCSAASSTNDPEGHTQLDNISESKEMKPVKRRKRVGSSRHKKRKLSSNSSLPSEEDTKGTSARSTSFEVSNLVPATALGVRPSKLRRKLLVLDINGLLTDIVNYVSKEYTPDTIISRKAVFRRPFCDDFLRFCFEKFHVGVWSSRTKKNLKSAIDFLMGELKNKLVFCWNQTHCTKTGFYTLENREKPMLLKELKKLWEKHEPSLPWERGDYNESNTLLVDDSPYKALRNPPYTAIFPNPYCYKDVNDKSLGPGGDLRVYLERLASADDVRKYVEANPFGQRAITNANASWNFYRKVIQDNSSSARKIYK